MKKKAIFIYVLITIFIVIFTIDFMLHRNKKQNNILADNIIVIEKNSIIEETVETSIGYEKTTPNTILVLKKEYEDCGHIITNKMSMPEEMVNLTKEEILKKYPNWKIEDFSKEQIILSRKLESFCGEHYLLKEEDGYISIYMVDEGENATLKEKTSLSIEYLTEVDKINLKNGIMVYGINNLNKLLEDYET